MEEEISINVEEKFVFVKGMRYVIVEKKRKKITHLNSIKIIEVVSIFPHDFFIIIRRSLDKKSINPFLFLKFIHRIVIQ